MIDLELCTKFKFDHNNKRYMYKPESVQENKTQKVLTYFEIQTDQLISIRRLDLVIVNKREKLSNREFYPPSRPQSVIKRKWKER